MPQLNELTHKLKEIFQINRADLDFGIYRILNSRSQEIERYLSHTLPQAVKQALGDNRNEQLANWQAELEQAQKQAQDLGIDPAGSPKVQELQTKIAQSAKNGSDIESNVYRHLLTFFSRYYEDGDFISQRRYKGDTYAIPYNGEEVLLHWANKDQYYTKSGENFSNYRFKLDDGREVFFKLNRANTAKDNRKDNDTKRFFTLATAQSIEQESEDGEIQAIDITPISQSDNGKTLTILFDYKPFPKSAKQNKILADDLATVFANEIVATYWQVLSDKAPTEKNPNRTLLEKHLSDYTAKNTADYFIHKDLGGFLRRELDFYIKNEVMHLDEIQAAQAFANIETHLRLIQTLRAIAHEIIGFLAQLENFQKKLWLKKKFVADCHYLITLDKIPSEFHSQIFANPKQRDEWHKLYNLQSVTPPPPDNPHLVVNTALFDKAFQAKLLAQFDELDNHINGTIIHSDNFQALNLLQAKYQGQVKCIYIDPPYNTGTENEFIYKDNYQHSSWATLLENRFELAKHLMHSTAGIWISTDDGEYANLKLLMDTVFGSQNFVADVIWNSRKSVSNDALISTAINHTTFFAKNKIILDDNKKTFRLPESTDGFSNPDNDPRGMWKLDPMDAPNIRENLSYGITNPNTGEIFYPPEGRCWRFEEKDVLEYLKDGRILFGKTGKGRPAFKRFYEDAKEKGRTTKTLWDDVGTTSNGTQTLYSLYQNSISKDELNKIKPKPFDFMQKIFQLHRSEKAVYLDYFAGSGTTAHAVINLNREDGGNRQFILVEQGEYFDTVLKPRIQKVIFAKEYKDGQPVADKDGQFGGISQMVKVLKLESYEDTLNNLELRRSGLFDGLPEKTKQDYLLNYMLDIESRDSLLNVSHFTKPFDYGLNISQDSAGAYAWQTVDLVETFNYLIGASVISIDDKRTEQGYVAVECRLKNQNDDGKTLIFWRDCERIGYDELQTHFKRLNINPANSEYSQVFVNGDHTLETAWDGEQSGQLKVLSIEEAFLALMFEGAK